MHGRKLAQKLSNQCVHVIFCQFVCPEVFRIGITSQNFREKHFPIKFFFFFSITFLEKSAGNKMRFIEI